MPSIVAAQPEKPNHYTYLKSFRTEQCKDFLNHRCKLHRPYTCFHWHFPNQRRRRPIRKRDGSFNYSSDEYCPNYDESTGTCPEGDSCPLLHHTVGDIEKHYHLRYYKTELCMHKMNSAGVCSKNGPHCMFAHGTDDLREPVYNVAETDGGAARSVSVSPPSMSQSGDVLQMLDEEPIDPRWNDRSYILNYYKTEKCPKWTVLPLNRVCRLGLVCPFHHSFKDRRRSLATVKYRAIACPMVKVNDEWGDVSECDRGDSCPYCHTRMELQYHPDVYKSIKCDKFQSTGHCPKGQFCAFAHVDEVMGPRTCSPAVSDPATSVSLNKIIVNNGTSNSNSNSSSMNNLDRIDGLTEIAVNTAVDRNNSSPKPDIRRSSDPTVQQQQQQQNIQLKTAAGSDLPVPNGFRMPPGALPNGLRMAPGFDMLPPDFGPRFPGYRGPPSGPPHESQLGLSGLMSEMGINGNGPGHCIGFPPPPMHMMSMMARMRGPLMMPDMIARRQLLMQQAAHLRQPTGLKPSENQLKVSTSLGGGLSSGEGNDSIDNLDFDFDTDIRRTARTSGSDVDDVVTTTELRRSRPTELSPSGLADISPGSTSSGANSKPLLDSPGSSSPTTTNQFFPPTLSSYDQQSLIQHCARLRMELDFSRTKIETIEDEKRKLFHEKEMVLEHLAQLKANETNNVNSDGQYLRSLHPLSSLDELTVPLLQHIETQLKNDLQRVKTIILQKAAGKCLNCLERSASIRLPLCHHKVLCEVCYMKTNECPSCQASVTIPQP